MGMMIKLCLAWVGLSAVVWGQTAVARVTVAAPAANSQETKVASASAILSLDSGALDGRVYTNEYFAFRYTIPEGLSSSDVHVPRQSSGGDAVLVSFPVVLVSARDNSGRTLTMMADAAGSPSDGTPDLNSYLRRVTGSMRARGFEVLRETAEYTYAGQRFFRADYRRGTVYESAIFTLRSGYALGLTVAAEAPAQVNELCQSLTSLTFIGPERPAPRIAGMPGFTSVTGAMVRLPAQTNRELSGTSGAEPAADCPAKPAGTPTRVRVSAGVAEGTMLLSKVPPEYPLLARQARIQGQVRLSAVIGCNGKARELQFISGHPMLVRAAMDAVRKWRYKPYQLNGQAVEVETTVAVDFTLE